MTSVESILEDIFNKKVKSFIIHLEQSYDRKILIDNLIKNTNTNIEIISAIDGNLHTHVPHKCPYETNCYLCVKFNNNHYRSNGEIGCLLSHLKIWKRIVDENIDYALIYEDDCCFINSLENLKIDLDNIKDDLLKCDGFLLGALGYRNSSIYINSSICKVNQFDGTHALLISKYMASKLIEFHEQEQLKGFLHPADGHFYSTIKEYNLNVYGFINYYKYFYQNNGPSYIANTIRTE